MTTDDKIRAIDALTRIISSIEGDELIEIAKKKLINIINSLEIA